MLKARASNGLFILGLEAENLRLLQQGHPMPVDLKEIGGRDKVLIIYGETKQDIALQLEEATGYPLPAVEWK